MSFFSKTQISQLKKNNQKIIRIAVSNAPINPTIAITTSNKIHLYNQSGQKHQYQLSRAITPTAIQWHPFNQILAIGWDNGRITIWNDDTKSPKQQGKPHTDPILMIRFNSSGSRMVTSDLTGTLAIWRGINLLAVYTKQWAITQCVFSDIPMQNTHKTNSLGTLFLFAGRSGTVCLANDLNMCSDVCRVGGTIKALMFYQKQGSAIVITSNLLLVQFKINFTQKSVPQKKVKLSISGQPQNLSSIWIGQSLLCTCSNQNMIRFWHLQNDQNYNLTVFDVLNSTGNNQSNLGTDKISTTAYNPYTRSLVAGTRQGRLMFWKNGGIGQSPASSDMWAVQPYLNLGKQIQLLTVGKNNSVIVCKQADGQVIIISQTKITGRVSQNYSMILKSSDTIQIKFQYKGQKLSKIYNTGMTIKGVDMNNQNILYWTNKSIQVISLTPQAPDINIRLLCSIKQKTTRAVFGGNGIIAVSDHSITFYSYAGSILGTISLPQSQGKIIGIDVNNIHMVLWTQSSYMRIFNLQALPPQSPQPRRFENSKGLLGLIKSCSINSNGTCVSIVSSQVNNNISYDFWIYDLITDSFVSHKLNQTKIPVKILWDKKQPRFFGVNVQVSKQSILKSQSQQKQSQQSQQQKSQKQQQQQQSRGNNRQFLTFFYTSQTGIKHQDKYTLRQTMLDIFELKIPYFYSTDRIKQQYVLNKTTLHDFVRINTQDQIIKSSILNFSFHLTAGNLDQAYKSVKAIQSPQIWQKMAVMCVKGGRVDVAQVCINNMKFARGARSIRQAKKQPQHQSQLAMVALQLGMIDQAKSLYQSSGRYDLLVRLLLSNNQGQKAIQIAQKYNRIDLKHTYYQAAKFNEAQGKYQQAIQGYQKAGVVNKQVPRMLLEAHRIDQLIQYINKVKTPQLYTWLGQYKQSIGQIQEAIQCYNQAKSSSNLVRLYLSQNLLQQSIKICNNQSQPQACFLLARHMQKTGMLSQAIHFYAKAQYYSQAIKIAIANQLDGQIISLSISAPKQVALRSAVYFQRKGLIQKAIRLYKKAGATKKSNTLAEQNGFTQLITTQTFQQQQSQDQDQLINGGDKSAILARATQLIQSGKYQKAVPLLVSIKQYQRALDICIQHNVTIKQQLVKKILPDQQPTNPLQRGKRIQLMKTLAQKCRKQGNFQLASNLYVRLADKQKAVKCLIQLGDHNGVVIFANNARSAPIYILAANFLQTANWHQNPQLMKNIIGFYQKAKAYDQLAGFFEACANVQIDQYRDYQKASAAIKQALKHISKSTSSDKNSKIDNLNYKKNMIDKFIQIKQMAQTNPQGMVSQCLNLLQKPQIDQCVRRGDLYSIAIQYHYQMQQYDRCLNYLKLMKQNGIVITPYVDRQIIQTVYKQLGISNKARNNNNNDIDQQVIQDIS